VDGEEVNDKTLAHLERHAGEAGFALKLMNAMGPERVRRLLAKTDGRDKKSQRLQAALGKTLGSASAQLSPQWRKDLTASLSRHTQAGIAAALKHGTFNSAFLLEVAKALDATGRKQAMHHTVGRHPMADVMKALSKHPDVAQGFFASGDRLKYYTTMLPLGDGGVAVDEALEAATMFYRDRAGSAAQPSSGYLSAKLASDLIHLEYEQIKAGKPQEAFVAPISIGRILAAYVIDVDRAAKGGIEKPGVYEQDHPGLPGPEAWGVKFDRQELREVMKNVFTKDEKAFGLVMAAQAALSSRLFDHAAAQPAGKDRKNAMASATLEAAAGFGMLAHAAGVGKIEKGRELDESQKRNIKILMAVINTGLGLSWRMLCAERLNPGTRPLTEGRQSLPWLVSYLVCQRYTVDYVPTRPEERCRDQAAEGDDAHGGSEQMPGVPSVPNLGPVWRYAVCRPLADHLAIEGNVDDKCRSNGDEQEQQGRRDDGPSLCYQQCCGGDDGHQHDGHHRERECQVGWPGHRGVNVGRLAGHGLGGEHATGQDAREQAGCGQGGKLYGAGQRVPPERRCRLRGALCCWR
jgi:hypothetical protein